MKASMGNLRARIRRRTQDKVFVYLMIALSLAFVYCFGGRPDWLYGKEPTELWSWRWQIDTMAHCLFGIGFCWIMIYGDRLSTETPFKWARNIICTCATIGVLWEVAVEMPFDLWLLPWMERVLLPYLANSWQIYWPLPEAMQKGNIDTNIDLLAAVLGAISGLVLWKFVWGPAYAFLFPSQAREEYHDELDELCDYSRKRTLEIQIKLRGARREEKEKNQS